jgi:outer membrane protein
MRHPARVALAALALSLPAAARSAQAQAAPKLAYVDVALVMDQVPGRAEAQQAFEREATTIRTEAQRIQDSAQTALTNYQRQQASLTPAQRQARETAINAYGQRLQALQERGARREQELATQFESLVRQAIEDVRTSGGYTMIFAAGSNSAMLAADRSLDVTTQVTARMRTLAASRPAGGAAQPAANPATPPANQAGAPAAAPAGAARPRPPQR